MDGVETESVGQKLLVDLHPAMPLDTRIAVVGGGPSGLGAALALTKLGYERVTVLECQPTVGGMCASAVIEGRVYDLGGQVLARESSPTLLDLMAEMQVEMEDMGGHKLSEIDCSNGQHNDLKVAADYISLMPHTLKLQAEAEATRKLGVHALSDLAHQPADEYLQMKGIARNGVPTAVANGFTASGFGFPSHMPYAYLHEFARTSMMGKIWRVRGGYSSFWEKVANCLPDVQCNVEVEKIDRTGDKVQIYISSSPTSKQQTALEFDKVIMTGSVAYPKNSPTYQSSPVPENQDRTGILDYTPDEEQIFSKVRTIEYYTTVLKVSGLDLPVGFYYPKIYKDDPDTIGHPVAIQRFFADTNIYLFWSYGKADIPQKRVTELLLTDVQNMGGKDVEVILQKKWNYFPHVSSTDMAEGFYDKLNMLQGENNTYFLGALLAFELTERNVSYAFNLMGQCFGSREGWPYVKKLMPVSLSRSKGEAGQQDRSYDIEQLDELPGVQFPDLPSLDAYLSYYARHKVVGDRVLFTWLDDHGRETEKRTFVDLDRRATIVAHHLLHGKYPVKAGDRVLLLHPSGLDFIEAFFGCLRARVLPVPVIPPDPAHRGRQGLAMVQNVAKACEAKAILSTFSYHAAVRASSLRNVLSVSKKSGPSWPNLPWHYTDSWTQQGQNPWNWLFSKATINSINIPSLVPNSTFDALQGENPKIPSNEISSSNSKSPRSQTPRPSVTAGEFSSSEITSPNNTSPRYVSPRSVLESAPDERSSDDGYEKPNQDFDFGRPDPNPSDVCFLQFTSGSTGESKGVMISHGGLIHNVKLMRSKFKTTSKTVAVSWLPHHHDMGLIGGLLTTLVSGGTSVLFSPITFIRKPLLWLEAMTRYKATHCAAPNFAFELIVRRYQHLQAAGKAPTYDLSSLRFLMNSAEPIRHKTLQTFLELLHSSGMREQVIGPGYGLAENCVFVCLAYGRGLPIYVDWQGRVCCGYITRGDKDADVRIVDPITFEEMDLGVEGEIWVSCPSMGVGYWGQKELSDQTFGNKLQNADADDQNRKFLRTGDLGRVLDGKLFVTGRIKDLIIVRGRNFYPADIEKVVEDSSDALRPGCSAVFAAPHSVLKEKGVSEQSRATEDAGVVVVAELRDEKKIDAELPMLIKANVAEEFGLEVAHVSFIKPRTIPKTTSGKIRRKECLKRFAENRLEIVQTPKRPSSSRRRRSPPIKSRKPITLKPQSSTQTHEGKIPSKTDIVNFLIQIVAERTITPVHTINADEGFASYGIDSVGIVWAAQKLSGFLGVHVAAIDVYTAGTISELAETSNLLVRKGRSSPDLSNASLPQQAVTQLTGVARRDARHPSKQDIERFLAGLVAQRTGMAASEVSTTESLAAYNIDSVGVVWAAQKISDHLGLHIAAIDVYTAGCIAELAELSEALLQKAYPEGLAPEAHSDTLLFCSMEDFGTETLSEEDLANSLEPSLARRIAITSLQAVGIIYVATLLLLPASVIFRHLTTFIITEHPIRSVVVAAFVVPLAWIAYIGMVSLVISVFGACLLRPNKFTNAIPLWTAKYVKWWTLYRLQEFASNTLAVHLRGTVFLVWWYRLLGAHIGERVQLDTTDITDPNLMFVGNNVVIEEGATLQGHEVNGGVVYLRPVKISNEARVGAFSVLQCGSVVDTRAAIPPLGKTEVGQLVAGTTSKTTPPKGHNTGTKALAVRQVFGLYLVGLVSTTAAMVAYLPFLWSASKLEIFKGDEIESHNFATGGILFALAATFPWAVVGIAPVLTVQHSGLLFHSLVTILESRKLISLAFSLGGAYFVYGVVLSGLTIALKWCLIGKLNVNDEANSSSKRYYPIWLVHTLLRFTHFRFIGFLSGTEATCMYLRCLGAKIGKLASTRGGNALVDPDLISFGAKSHLGDFAKIITSVSNADSSFTLGKVSIAKGCLVGAQSVIMPGATLEDESWLGAMSVASSNSVLQSGGVYVGVNSSVQIYQKNASGERTPSNSNASDEKDYRIEQMDPFYQKLVANLSASIAKTTLSVNARFFHRLGVAGKGTLRIYDTLPGLPPNEFFVRGQAYPVLVRHNNCLSGDDDARLDARGASVRILQPDCGNNMDATLLDLTMITGRAFYARNLIEFVAYLTKNQDSRLKHVEKFPHIATIIWQALKDCDSYADMHYQSLLVRLFSSVDAVQHYIKFRLCPADPNLSEDLGRVEPSGVLPPEAGTIPRAEGDTRPLRYLSHDFKARVASPEGVRYKFQVQLRPVSSSEEENEEAEDSTRAWDTSKFPYLDVGELNLTEALDDEVTEKIKINPRNGPPCIAMIPATTAAQSASLDHGRSLAYDIAQYLRNGMPLPPAWQKLLDKADADQKLSIPGSNMKTMGGGGCPAMSGFLPDNVKMTPPEHKTNTKAKAKAKKEPEVTDTRGHEEKGCHPWEQVVTRTLQPFIQVVLPIMLMTLSFYPSVLLLALVDSKWGSDWTQRLFPMAYLFSGLILATLSVLARWVLLGRNREGKSSELWSPSTSCDTTWQSINLVLSTTFLGLGKGSLLTTWYFRALGASISSTAYMDTLYAVNPDLLKIGEGSVVGHNAVLLGHIYEGGKVQYKSNSIGNYASVGTSALVLPGLKMEDDSHLPTLGLGMKDEVIAAY